MFPPPPSYISVEKTTFSFSLRGEARRNLSIIFHTVNLTGSVYPLLYARLPYAACSTAARLVPLDLRSRSIARDASSCTRVEFLWGETPHSFVPFTFTAISPQIYIHTNSYRASSNFLDPIGNAPRWMQHIHARPFDARIPHLDPPVRLKFSPTLDEDVSLPPSLSMKLRRHNENTKISKRSDTSRVLTRTHSVK